MHVKVVPDLQGTWFLGLIIYTSLHNGRLPDSPISESCHAHPLTLEHPHAHPFKMVPLASVDLRKGQGALLGSFGHHKAVEYRVILGSSYFL